MAGEDLANGRDGHENGGDGVAEVGKAFTLETFEAEMTTLLDLYSKAFFVLLADKRAKVDMTGDNKQKDKMVFLGQHVSIADAILPDDIRAKIEQQKNVYLEKMYDLVVRAFQFIGKVGRTDAMAKARMERFERFTGKFFGTADSDLLADFKTFFEAKSATNGVDVTHEVGGADVQSVQSLIAERAAKVGLADSRIGKL